MALVADHFLGAAMGDDASALFDPVGRSRFYGAMHKAHGGITLLSEFTQPSKDHVLVNVPGSALEQLPGGGLHAVAAFLGQLVELQPVAAGVEQGEDVEVDDVPVAGRVFKVTRFDIAFDQVPFTVQQCIDAASDPQARNVRSSVRKGTAFHSLGERDVGEDGDTFTWGARASKSRMIRVYDRRQHETGVRLEMEWRGDRSDSLARSLADRAPHAWGTLAIAHLRDFIDFVDCDSSSNISRCSLLPWWAEFVQGVDRIRVKIERPARPLVAKVATLVRRYRKGVAMFSQAYGFAWVKHHLVRMGEFSMTPEDRRDVTAMRQLGVEDPDAVGLYDTLREAAAGVVAVVAPTWHQQRLVFGG